MSTPRSIAPTALLWGLALAVASGCQPDNCMPKTEADLQWLSGLGDLTCDLYIQRTQLENLDALAGIRSAPNVIITDNPALTDISGIGSLESVTYFFVGEGNASLTSIDLDLEADVTGELSFTGGYIDRLHLDMRPDADVAQLTVSRLYDLTDLAVTGGVAPSRLGLVDLGNLPSLNGLSAFRWSRRS